MYSLTNRPKNEGKHLILEGEESGGDTFGWVRSTILGRRSKSDIPEIKKYTLFKKKTLRTKIATQNIGSLLINDSN